MEGVDDEHGLHGTASPRFDQRPGVGRDDAVARGRLLLTAVAMP